MLGRTAANLFWLSRYVERAENMARLLDAGYRMWLTVRQDDGGSDHLISMMQAAEVDEEFNAKYRTADLPSVANFMLFDPDNPSSVRNCLFHARTNARSVRTAITTDMWESLNSTWLEFEALDPGLVQGAKLPELLQWIKLASHQFRGALLGTILRDDGFGFLQLGNFVERADNTARILDMKYFVLLPGTEAVGGDIDVQQWTLILRAASAHRSYRHVYHDRYKAWNIADYLILRQEMPRSLRFCAHYTRQTLKNLADLYGTRVMAHEEADRLYALLRDNTVDQIFQRGLHEFLTEFIAANNRITESLSEGYSFY